VKQQWRPRRTTNITVGLVAVLAGLGFTRVAQPAIWQLIILCVLSVALLIKQPKLSTLIIAVLIGFGFGWWRGGQFMNYIKPYQSLARQPLVVQVTAASDGVYGDNTQLEFDGDKVTVLEPAPMKLPGRLKIKGFGERAVYRGDVVRVQGSLFPTRGSRVATISYANLRVTSRSKSFIENVRLRFVAGMTSALPEPQASFGLGLLIGQRTTLPDQVQDNLSAVGLTHIIAVSGYNLTILIVAVRRFRGRLSKYQITVLSLLLMGGFILVTGFSASIVRAAIVSTLSLAAWYYGRNFRPFLLLMIAAAGTALWSPLYIWSDIGWYLSFLAFYGVLVLVPLVMGKLYTGRKQPRALTMTLLETVAAQLMTAPLILYIFGEFSAVAIISNLLVVPLVPAAMLLSLIAGLAGMVLPALAGWAALPGSILLKYMLEVARLLGSQPHALVQGALPLAGVLAVYALIAAVCIVLWRQTGVKRDILAENQQEI
jgi:ComEC/Rec2-related protein